MGKMMGVNNLCNFQRHLLQASAVGEALVCACGENHMLYDSHHDEVFCFKCGTVIMRNGIIESHILTE